MFRQGFHIGTGDKVLWALILLSATGLPFIAGLWVAQVIAKLYGLVSACLMAAPFFHDDFLKMIRRQAEVALLHKTAAELRDEQIAGVDEMADEHNVTHLNMMRIGLILLAAAFAIEIVVLLTQPSA